MQLSQSTHRQTFIDILAEEIRRKAAAESMSMPVAASRVVLSWLDYDLDDLTLIDSQDRGIDAWLATGEGFEIFQIKTHESDASNNLDLSPFNGKGIGDLARARDFFVAERDTNVTSKSLKQLLYQRDTALRNHKLQNNTLHLSVTLHLVILGDRLTEQANAELEAFKATIARDVKIDDVPVQFHAVLHTIDDIVNKKWRENNRKWVDSSGRVYEKIRLNPGPEGAINDHANAIFYCKAIDLVNAYDTLGYQLFEPNVRANINNSPVNRAIRDSVLHQRTRRDFKFLNNGVTITCDSFIKPTKQNAYFTVVHPGVVNGLQTVVALHTAYQVLTPQDKKDFEMNCSLMVRLLMNSAVDDISRVVKATNNQNPMKARNLVSNNSEQLIYVRVFAEKLGWFYESKQGAWDAFEKDYKRWRPSLNKRPKEFQTHRRRTRRIDNAYLAQTWLAFIGFSAEAVNDKKSLFDERFYSLIFKQQTRKHSADYDFSLARAREDTIDQSPHAALMLTSFLLGQFADEAVPTAAQNRQEACDRLGIDVGRLTKAELDAQLSKDPQFLLNQALTFMSLLFVDFVGFIFYRSLGENIHRYGERILANHSFRALADQFDTDAIKNQCDSGKNNEHDLLIILWSLFKETIDDMINSSWGQSYRAAPVKARFVFSRETRDRLFKDIQQLDEYMKKRSIKKPWAVGVADGQGLFEFVRSCTA